MSSKNNYIIFNHSGRFGNAVFRYMAYTMLQKNIENGNIDCNNNASKFTYILDSDFSKIPEYSELKENSITINEDNFFEYVSTNITNNTCKSKIPNNKNISLQGYFQYDEIYLQNKNYILEFVEKHKNVNCVRTDNDIFLTKYIIDDMELDPSKLYENVIHIRLGDFNSRPDFIEIEYFLRLLDGIKEIFVNATANSTAIVMETPSNIEDKKYVDTVLSWFIDNNTNPPIIESNDLITDYNIMKQAKVIISSMSTLCWTAAYFSKSLEKIYMPNYNFFDIDDRKNGCFKKPIQNTILYDVKTTKFTDIKVVILTLEKYSQRMHKVYDLIIKLSQLGLQCSLFYGVNGEDIKITKTDHANIHKLEYKNEIKYYDSSIRINGVFMGRGELGAAWSHINIYKSLLREVHVDKYLIFEDDVEFVESLEYLYECLTSIPNDCDMCHIAKADWYPFIKQNKINDIWYTVVKQYFNRLTAYIVSKEGAKKILQHVTNYINIPCDDLLSSMHLANKLNVYVPDKYIFHEPTDTISITGNIK